MGHRSYIGARGIVGGPLVVHRNGGQWIRLVNRGTHISVERRVFCSTALMCSRCDNWSGGRIGSRIGGRISSTRAVGPSSFNQGLARNTTIFYMDNIILLSKPQDQAQIIQFKEALMQTYTIREIRDI